MSTEDFEKHIRAVLRGRKKSLSKGTRSTDDSLAEDYFRALTDLDVDEAFTSAEYEKDRDARRHSISLLVAYFDWCSQIGKDTVGGRPLREFVERFAWITVRKMCGRSEERWNTDSYQLPHWHSPDVAFGWRSSKWRPHEESLHNIGSRVAAYVEIQTRNGCTVAEAKSRAATYFARPGGPYSTSWVDKRLGESVLPTEFLAGLSEDDLRDALKELSEK